MRVANPQNKVRLKVGSIYQKTLRAVRPSEMLKVKLSHEELAKLPKDTTELVVGCVQKE